MANLLDTALSAARDRLAREPWVDVAVLFGSGAKGKLRPDSDIDVFVVPAPGAPQDYPKEQALRSDLERVFRRDVDLVVEDPPRTSLILRFAVARTGIVLFERTPDRWTTVKAQIMLTYYDFLPFMERCAEGVRRAIARGAGRG